MNTTDLTQNIDLIVEAGGTVTDEYKRLRGRAAEYFELRSDAITELAEAVVSDQPMHEIITLRGLAIADQASTSAHQATVWNQVAAVLNQRMRAEYGKTAEANYNHFRDRFNDAAAAFTAAHNVTPFGTNPAQLVTAPEKARKAWADGQTAAATLNDTMPLLVLAAQLAGARIHAPNTPIGLVADVTGLHRRRVWEAFEEGWAALLDLGATLRAPDLEDFQDYRAPKPIEYRNVQGEIGIRRIEVDPEDEQHSTTADTFATI